MNRVELEGLDREDLIARAEGAGRHPARDPDAPRARRRAAPPERDQATKQRSRGLFGRARDLLASVVERGLNLPDAAERIRSVGGVAPSRPGAPAALPTVTLAEIYAAQGHRDRADRDARPRDGPRARSRRSRRPPRAASRRDVPGAPSEDAPRSRGGRRDRPGLLGRESRGAPRLRRADAHARRRPSADAVRRRRVRRDPRRPAHALRILGGARAHARVRSRCPAGRHHRAPHRRGRAQLGRAAIEPPRPRRPHLTRRSLCRRPARRVRREGGDRLPAGRRLRRNRPLAGARDAGRGALSPRRRRSRPLDAPGHGPCFSHRSRTPRQSSGRSPGRDATRPPRSRGGGATAR